MKKLISILISVISIYSATAQKYTDQYIKDANEVAENWLSDINNKEYDNAYNLLTKEIKHFMFLLIADAVGYDLKIYIYKKITGY